MAGYDHAVVAELVGCDAHAEVGARTTASLLVQTLRVSPGEATLRVRAAKELGPRADFTGGSMDPQFPIAAAAQADGVISAAHARIITTTVRDLPAAVRAEHGAALERFLVDQACDHAPDFLTRTAKHATAVLDPDGTLASAEDHRRRRGLSLSPNADGSSDIRGHLTPECAAIVRAVLDPLAKPAPASKTCPAGDTGCCDTRCCDTPAADTPAADTPTADTPAADTPLPALRPLPATRRGTPLPTRCRTRGATPTGCTTRCRTRVSGCCAPTPCPTPGASPRPWSSP